METISERVVHIMDERKYKVQQLAELIGVTAQTVYDLRSGRNKNPGTPLLNGFKSIGINPEWVKYGTGDMELAEGTEKGSGETAYLMEALKKIEDTFTNALAEKDKIIAEYKHLLDIYRTNPGFRGPSTPQPSVFTEVHVAEHIAKKRAIVAI